jgi:hypothetical protein
MMESEASMFKMSNELYDILKEIALTILPAIAVLYATLGKIWGLPYVGEVPATIMAIDTFLGVCLHISNAEYKAGDSQ